MMMMMMVEPAVCTVLFFFCLVVCGGRRWQAEEVGETECNTMQSSAIQCNGGAYLRGDTRPGFLCKITGLQRRPGNDDEGGGHEEEKEEEEEQRRQQRRRAILEEIRNEGPPCTHRSGKRRRNAGLVTERAKICLCWGRLAALTGNRAAVIGRPGNRTLCLGPPPLASSGHFSPFLGGTS